MPRIVLAAFVFLAAACGDRGGAPTAALQAASIPAPEPARSHESLAAELAATRAGCVRCHAAGDGASAGRLQVRSGPPLATAAAWQRADGGEALLQRHHGGAAAADLAAWVGSLTSSPPPVAPVPVAADAIARGERLFGALACAACHGPDDFATLPARVDAATLTAFLREPAAHRPSTPHPRLDGDEAMQVAAWLLRSQLRSDSPGPGFAFACYEQPIRDAGLPDLAGSTPVATGITAVLDAARGSRENNYVLRFDATLDVPATGDWTFVTGSDDSSWLWIDDQLVVRNEALAPHRRRDGTVALTAGPHALRVMFTQAAGGASLEVLWRGPDTPEQPLPAARASSRQDALVPPAPRAAAAAAAIERGRLAARQLRCDACHTIDEPAFAALPAPRLAKPFPQLGGGECPQQPGAAAIALPLQAALQKPLRPADELFLALQADGCVRCHERDGSGGLPPPVRERLVEVEDIGDEGRLPPSLTAVGSRLRPKWIEQVLTGARRARLYLRARMPHTGPEQAARYAAWFAAVDGAAAAADAEPEFTPAAAARGRELAGTTGKNCITCHTFQGSRSLGPQGMDLGLQYERTRPEWFRDWLLRPHQLRPGTRMPALWPVLDDAARRDADALRVWSSLGSAAPLPSGLLSPGALVLQPSDRPVLHGAFLRDVSARCLCVGTPERTHFAYDLASASLVWLWRGAFVDAAGTWSGRAGELLLPAGSEHVVLREPRLTDGQRTLLGQRRTAGGYPVLVVGVGDARYEDEARPRLVAGGSEVVRTLRSVQGTVEFVFETVPGVVVLVDGANAGRHTLTAGRQLEVVYRW